MKTPFVLGSLFLFNALFHAHAEPLPVLHRDPSPPAGRVSQDLFWIADTVKMDRFLDQVDMKELRRGASGGEILPDTRAAWHGYARQARMFAEAGKDDAAIDRLCQMVKLAAVYRQFGGFQNVAQGEEIRCLAGHVAEELNFGGRLPPMYLECCVQDCVHALETNTGLDVAKVPSEFWQHFVEYAAQNWARLTTRRPRTAMVTDSAR